MPAVPAVPPGRPAISAAGGKSPAGGRCPDDGGGPRESLRAAGVVRLRGPEFCDMIATGIVVPSVTSRHEHASKEAWMGRVCGGRFFWASSEEVW